MSATAERIVLPDRLTPEEPKIRGLKFSKAIDLYVSDMRATGRLNSDRSEVSYRAILVAHMEDVANRDPATVGRVDCKRTLARWANPNTQQKTRSVLISFYDWTVEEGMRPSNPARQTRKPKKRPTTVYRLTRDEAAVMLAAASGKLERRAIYLGLCAGLRSAELRGVRGRHFVRDGLVWVSADVAKGGRERWVPVLEELEPIVAEISENVQADHFVLPGQVNANPPLNTRWREVPTQPMGGPTLWRMVGRVAKRAGIAAHIHPHLLRHGYGDHIARATGLLVAQEMLGHADVGTTRGYVDRPSLDELTLAVRGLRYRRQTPAANPLVETVGIEPTSVIA
jgi:integrase/recombinase XerC